MFSYALSSSSACLGLRNQALQWRSAMRQHKDKCLSGGLLARCAVTTDWLVRR